MKAHWDKLAAKFNALSRRERAIVAVAAIFGTLLLGNALFIDPTFAKSRALRQSIDRQAGELAGLMAQSAALEALLRVDPDAGKRTEIAQLKLAVKDADEQLERLESGLIPPERMTLVLESLLRRHPGLRLVSFRTLAPVSLMDRPADKAEGAPAREFNLFRHGVEIQLEGTFPDLQSYLAQLEQGPRKFLWGEMRLSVVQYPKSRLTLVIYTLGTDRTWLAI